MGIIITIFTWLWNHRRAITAWGMAIALAAGTAWLSTYLLSNIVDLVCGSFTSVSTTVCNFMDTGRTYLDGWVATTGVEWIDTIYQISQISYFVDCLIGFSVFFIGVVTANLVGLGVALLGYSLRYIFIVYKARRAAQIARLNNGGL